MWKKGRTRRIAWEEEIERKERWSGKAESWKRRGKEKEEGMAKRRKEERRRRGAVEEVLKPRLKAAPLHL